VVLPDERLGDVVNSGRATARGRERCMAPTAKEAQRAEFHKAIWRIANDLRGSVDGWDFKSYVLGMLFYRFISENLTAYLNAGEHRAGSTRATGLRRMRPSPACGVIWQSSCDTRNRVMW
jgi:hypothetical protein